MALPSILYLPAVWSTSLLQGEKKKGKKSPIFLRCRENTWQHILFLLHSDFRGESISTKEGPSFAPTAVRGKLLKEVKLHPCSCSKAERVLTSSLWAEHIYRSFAMQTLLHKYTLKAFKSECDWTTGLTTQSRGSLLRKYIHRDCSRSFFITPHMQTECFNTQREMIISDSSV